MWKWLVLFVRKVFQNLFAWKTAGFKFRVTEKRYSTWKTLSLSVTLANPEASKGTAYKLSGLYENNGDSIAWNLRTGGEIYSFLQSSLNMQFWGPFAKLRKLLLASSCLSVCLSVRRPPVSENETIWLPYSIFEGLSKICREISSLIQKSEENNCYSCNKTN